MRAKTKGEILALWRVRDEAARDRFDLVLRFLAQLAKSVAQWQDERAIPPMPGELLLELREYVATVRHEMDRWGVMLDRLEEVGFDEDSIWGGK